MLLNCFVTLSLTASRDKNLNGTPLIEKTSPFKKRVQVRTLTILSPKFAKPNALMRTATYLVRPGTLSQLSVNTD